MHRSVFWFILSAIVPFALFGSPPRAEGKKPSVHTGATSTERIAKEKISPATKKPVAPTPPGAAPAAPSALPPLTPGSSSGGKLNIL